MHDNDGWKMFGVRDLPMLSGRERVELPPGASTVVDERRSGMTDPFVGITTNGAVLRGLRTLDAPRVPTQAITDAALAFLDAVSPSQRAQACPPMDSGDWRTWNNVHPNLFRHGILLEDLTAPQRALALGVLRATLSDRGYEYATGIMRLNGLAAEIVDNAQYGEWVYFLSIFGSPGSDAPWGWQIDGHHLCMNTVVFENRVVTTPTFFGSEPRSVGDWSIFDHEEDAGVALMLALGDRQRREAIIHPSIHPAELPDLQHPVRPQQRHTRRPVTTIGLGPRVPASSASGPVGRVVAVGSRLSGSGTRFVVPGGARCFAELRAQI